MLYTWFANCKTWTSNVWSLTNNSAVEVFTCLTVTSHCLRWFSVVRCLSLAEAFAYFTTLKGNNRQHSRKGHLRMQIQTELNQSIQNKATIDNNMFIILSRFKYSWPLFLLPASFFWGVGVRLGLWPDSSTTQAASHPLHRRASSYQTEQTIVCFA